jgi:hypothetical protein
MNKEKNKYCSKRQYKTKYSNSCIDDNQHGTATSNYDNTVGIIMDVTGYDNPSIATMFTHPSSKATKNFTITDSINMKLNDVHIRSNPRGICVQGWKESI